MLVDMFDAENEAVINDMAQRPRAPKPPVVSIWGQAREVLASPFKGMAQAVMQTTRVAKEFAPVQVGNPMAMTVTEQEDMLADEGISRSAMDRALRKGIDEMNPDPLTATMASQFLQQGARVVTKAMGYSVMAGPAGAIVGTGIDEGATGFMELRDRGVDTATAAKAGAVRGATMAASVAMPVVGKTLARTAGLVAVGGPGLFVAEQSATREILQRARYGQIADEYDPLDPMGLALSVAVPGAIGAAMHRARVRSTAPAETPSPWEAMAKDPEAVDAALVSHRVEATTQAALHAADDIAGGNAHVKTLNDAIKAMDEGTPVQAFDVVVDPVVAARAMDDLNTRMRAARTEMEADTPAPAPDVTMDPPARVAEPFEPVQGDPTVNTAETIVERVREVVEMRGAQRAEPQQAAEAQRPMAPEVQRAQELVARMPDLPVRMNDDGSAPMRAADLMEQTRNNAHRESIEARKAFEAAATCFLETAA